jgi:hypothetical protein
MSGNTFAMVERVRQIRISFILDLLQPYADSFPLHHTLMRIVFSTVYLFTFEHIENTEICTQPITLNAARCSFTNVLEYGASQILWAMTKAIPLH